MCQRDLHAQLCSNCLKYYDIALKWLEWIPGKDYKFACIEFAFETILRQRVEIPQYFVGQW